MKPESKAEPITKNSTDDNVNAKEVRSHKWKSQSTFKTEFQQDLCAVLRFANTLTKTLAKPDAHAGLTSFVICNAGSE